MDLVELGVLSDELLEVVDDEAVFSVLGVVSREGRELGGGEEAGEAAAAARRGGLGAGVGLAAGAGALVEEGGVDLGSDEVIGGAKVEGAERGERKGEELRVRESGGVYARKGLHLQRCGFHF